MQNGDTIINIKTEKIYTIENMGKHMYVSIRDTSTNELHTITIAALMRSFEKYYPKKNDKAE
ncbi:MAG: hypothetical protein K1X86_16795 [Ignavibacteria bacterium]|nr:hypothetical protein [Ignavibacteria bacterium]